MVTCPKIVSHAAGGTISARQLLPTSDASAPILLDMLSLVHVVMSYMEYVAGWYGTSVCNVIQEPKWLSLPIKRDHSEDSSSVLIEPDR